ncbi:MAG: 50S ribosomal protein L11 methyltransferase [Solirubrobacterales bacterium]|nr:50S ribosomal protein L11 methyltransferase [Solirubrobacterales bacterium]
MALLRLALRVAPDQAELVLAELLELAPGGVEEKTLGDGTVEYAVYGAPGELPALPDLTAAAGGALVDISTQEIADDWAERWRGFHRPLVIDSRLAVRPPWETELGARVELVIDPGQAFGTGAHATTRLCLEALLELSPGGPLVDLGSGSGVLGIAAAKLGWTPVLALDLEPAAVEASGANARRNGVALEVGRYDLLRDPVERSVAATVTANLLGPLLIAWSVRLQDAPELPRTVIASGLLVSEGDGVAEEFASLGFTEARRLTSGDWAALLLSR